MQPIRVWVTVWSWHTPRYYWETVVVLCYFKHMNCFPIIMITFSSGIAAQFAYLVLWIAWEKMGDLHCIKKMKKKLELKHSEVKAVLEAIVIPHSGTDITTCLTMFKNDVSCFINFTGHSELCYLRSSCCVHLKRYFSHTKILNL